MRSAVRGISFKLAIITTGDDLLSEDKPLFTPKDFIRYVARQRDVSEAFFNVPNRLILVYQRLGFEHAKSFLNGKDKEWLYKERPIHVGELDHVRIGVFRPWGGAPAAAAVLEELIACGANKIIEVGFAGGLQPSLKLGDIVVVTKAISGEGTSRYYFPHELEFYPSSDLTNLLVQELKQKRIKYFVGPVWTTDAFYRETKGRLLKLQQQGVMAVNCETSALFAVARYRRTKITSIQVISDIRTEEGYKFAFEDQRVIDMLKKSIEIAIQTLTKI